MNFNDTPEQAKFRSEIRSWLQANARPLAGIRLKGSTLWPTEYSIENASAAGRVSVYTETLVEPGAFEGKL